MRFPQLSLELIGREALDSAADVAKDLLSGRDFKTSATSRYNSAIDSLKEKAEKKIEGRGLKKLAIKRKPSLKNKIILKKRKIERNSDIFD
jgi:hypothetical protein